MHFQEALFVLPYMRSVDQIMQGDHFFGKESYRTMLSSVKFVLG